MITLITAVPGSGKTLYAVSIIQNFLDEGRPVYHNINGLQVDKFEHNHLLFDAPDDWTQTPDGSVVIYDECQQEHLYPATGQRGQVSDRRLTAMETHRHTGHDLFFITQAPTFVHHHVRKLVGEHIHFYRGGGATRVAKYTWSHTCDSPNDRREQERADFQTWAFDKKLYPLYKSNTVHTHKFRIPRKIAVLFFLIFAIFAVSAYSFSKGGIFGGKSFVASSPAPAVGQRLAGPAAAPQTTPYSYLDDIPTIKPVGGCISSDRACRCYLRDMTPIDLPQDQCRALIRSPVPMTAKVRAEKS